MELRQICYFVVLAEELHFGRAAERIPIAQSALSQQIRNLEEELGSRLFDRDTHMVALTETGDVFLKQALNILAALREAEMAVARTETGDYGKLNIGFVEAALWEVIPSLIRSFKEKFPHVEIRPHQMNSLSQIDALHQNEIQVGIVGTASLRSDLNYRLLRNEPYFAALPFDHPFAKRQKIQITDLTKENFVVIRRESGTFYYDQFIQTCMANGFSPNIVLTADRMQALLAFVASDIGIALIHESAKMIRSDLCYLPIEGKIPEPYSLFIAWKDQNPDILVENFLEKALLLYPGK